MGSHHQHESPQDEAAPAQHAVPSSIEARQALSPTVSSKSPRQPVDEFGNGGVSSPSTPTKSKPKVSSGQKGPVPGKQKIRIDTKSPHPQPVYDGNRQSTAQLREEQAYLVATLPGQNLRAGGYMNMMSELQEQLRAREVPSDQRRKTKKKISMTRKKIADASEQQRVILGRLGEIFVELQNRERWAQLVGGPMSAATDWFYMDSPMTPWTGTISTPSDMTPMMSPPPPPSLDATSPEFIPMGYFGFPPVGVYYQMYSQDWGMQPGGMEQHPSSGPNTSSSVTEPWGDEDTMISQPSKSDFDGLDPSTRNDSRDDVDTLEEDMTCSPYGSRRMSVPCMKSEWPENRGQEEDDKNGITYKTSTHSWDELDDDACDAEDVGIILDNRVRESVAL